MSEWALWTRIMGYAVGVTLIGALVAEVVTHL